MNYVYFILVTLLVLQARAQVRLVHEETKPIRVTLADGSEAQFFEVEGPAEDAANYPFNVSTNTCTPTVDRVVGSKNTLNCRLEVPDMLVGVALVWTKNSDPSKIGRTVQTRDAEVIFRSFVNVAAIDHMVTPRRGAKAFGSNGGHVRFNSNILPRIACDNYDWLPREVGPISIPRWSLVAPTTNSETQVIEPRPLADTFGATLTPTPSGWFLFNFEKQQRAQTESDFRYQFLTLGVRSLVPTVGYDGTPIQAHLSVQKESGEICDITLSWSQFFYSSSGSRSRVENAEIPEFYEDSRKPILYSTKSNASLRPELFQALKNLESILAEINPKDLD